ncbi:MAG TPA: hypothetical protein VHC86_06440 [Opitutaceae bacterium]|nr:hypothetical protein [Opitutaceae bacterium]
MRIGWLLGWAAPEGWFRPMAEAAFPGAEHAFFAAAPGAAERLAEGGFERCAGYSLGTLLLLEAADLFRGREVTLLAPILAFPREERLGGRVSRTQLKVLERWLRHDPLAALADFYERAALRVPPGQDPGLPENLLWGLERLEHGRVAPPLPAGWRGWCGEEDPLLNAGRLAGLDPAIRVVSRAGHHPRALLQAWAEAGA